MAFDCRKNCSPHTRVATQNDILERMMPSKRFVYIALGLLILVFGAFLVKQYTKEQTIQSALISVQKNLPFLSSGELDGNFVSLQDAETDTSKPKSKPTTKPTTVPSTEEVITSPVIHSLSRDVFGNGDTITIYGDHFMESNDVILSIDFKDAFTGIRSTDGKSITFTANLSLSQKVFEGISHLSPEMRKSVLKQMIIDASKDSPYKDGWYIPATISIKTEAGLSNIIPITVNITKGI